MRVLHLTAEAESESIRVHYLAANSPPLIRCNGDGDGDCSLCRLGLPILDRELLLVYDHIEDRLWAAALPVHIKEELFEQAEALPEHERNFLIAWRGGEYQIARDDEPQTSDFTFRRAARASTCSPT